MLTSPNAVLAVRAAAIVLLGAGVAGMGGRLATPDAHAQVPAGSWTTFANGDDVLCLVPDGAFLYAGTRAGGLVRWRVSDGTYIQYLRPQTPIGGNTVFAMARDGVGRLWLATEGGLTVFDPGPSPDNTDDGWFTYDTANGLGMPSDEVRSVAVDGDTVWIGGVQRRDAATGDWVGGGLGRLDHGGTLDPRDDRWAPVSTFESTYREEPGLSPEPGLVSDTINDILVSPQGKVWVAASPHWRFGSGADPTGPDEWQRQHGGLSFVDPRGTFDSSDDVWTGFSCELLELAVTCNVRRLALDPRGRGWAADGGRGVIHFDPELGQLGGAQARFMPPSETEGDAFVLDLAFGPTAVPALADTVWLATRTGGVAVLDHGGTLASRGDDLWNMDRGAPVGETDGLARDRVQAITWHDGRMRLGLGSEHGAGGGLQALDPETMTVAPAWRTTGAPPSNFITDLAFGAAGSRWSGQVWVATGARGGTTGSRLFGSGAATLDTAGTNETTDDVWSGFTALGTDADGRLPWSGLSSDNVQAVLLDGDTVWLGSAETRWSGADGRYVDGGLSVFDGARWTARPTGAAGGLGSGGVSSLALGCDGDLWVGTGNMWDHQGSGVFVRAPGSDVHQPSADAWTRHRYPQLASSNTTSLAVDCERGVVLVGALHHVNNADTGGPVGQWSGGGLGIFDRSASTWSRYTVDDGLESFGREDITGEVTSVASSGGASFLAGTYGVTSTTAAALVAKRPYWPAVLNELAGTQWQARVFERSGMVSSIATDAEGRTWVATSLGGMARDSISPDSWPATDVEGGLYVMQDGALARLTADGHGLPANDLSVVRVAPDGTIWVGTAGWGMARFDPRGLPPTPTPDYGLPTRTVTPTRDPDEPTPTRSTTPATVRPPWPSPTSAVTPARPGAGRSLLPVAFVQGHGTRPPVLDVHVYLSYAAGGR